MIKFKKVEVIPLSKLPPKVLIRWQTDASGSELKGYEFCVMKMLHGQDSQPNFQDIDIDRKLKTPIAPTLDNKNLIPCSTWIDGLDFPWFVDYSDTLKSLAGPNFYKLACRNKDTQETFYSEEFSAEGDIDLVGLYICDEVNFLLKDVTGVPCLVYQRRRGGVQCTACFDTIQKKRLTSSCRICYGTNWVGGFFNPIDTYIDFNPNPKNASIQQMGEIISNETTALMANFPNVQPGDIIWEMRDVRMWRVVQVNPTEKRRCQMLQMAQLTEVKAGDIEYRLHGDERFIIQKLDELNQIKAKREF